MRLKPLLINLVVILFFFVLIQGFVTRASRAEEGTAVPRFTKRINTSVEAALAGLHNKPGNGVQYTVDQKTGKLTFLKSQGGIPVTSDEDKSLNAVDTASRFMEEYGSLFGVNNPGPDLALTKETTDELGMKHVRYGQRYNGVPVFGGEIVVHLNDDLTVSSANGQAIPDVSMEVTPRLSSTEAIAKAEQLWKNQFDGGNPGVRKSDLYVFNRSLLNKNKEDQNILVWQIEFFQNSPSRREFYFIDAQNGDLVYQITGLKPAIDRRVYDCSIGDGDCHLDEYDAGSGYTMGRSEGQPSRGENPWYGYTDVDDLYDILGSTHDYFSSTYGRAGANNLGGLGDGIESPSAKTDSFTYFDGVIPWLCPNAFFSGSSVYFCYGLVYADVVAHEYGHGVDYFSVLDGSGDPAGLTYADESGALSESFADVFGEAVENYRDGSSDWLMGEDISVLGLVGPLRSMSDPASLSDPDRFYSSYYYCGYEDGGGVHTNSSVPNHAAYLMAMGGTFNGCTIDGIGRTKEEAIYYRALTQYLTTSSDFNDAYDALITSCEDLYGESSADCRNVTKALRSVEMNQGGACSSQPAVDPGCDVIDAPPTITSVSSGKANGAYAAGTVIDIDVTFSKEVVSSGNVTVTLETGATDRSCTFTVDHSATGSCNYTVRAGDKSTDLTVKSISGSIADIYGMTMTDFAPDVNLAANKNIRIVAPTLGILLSQASGSKPYIKRVGHHGAVIKSFRVYDVPGGISSVEADINGDVINEVVVAPEPGLGSKVKAYTKNGTALAFYSPFGGTFNKGISLAAGDVNGDGKDEIIVAPQTNGTPKIKVFRYLNGNLQLLKEKTVFGSSVPGGLNLSAGDVNGDGLDEIVVSPYQDRTITDRVVKVYAYRNHELIKLASKELYGSHSQYQGIRTITADLDGNGKEEIIATPSLNYGDDLVAYSYNSGVLTKLDDHKGYSAGFSGMTSLAAGDVNNDGKDEVVLSVRTGGQPYVFSYKLSNGLIVERDKFRVYDATFTGGVNLAVLDVDGDKKAEAIVAPYRGEKKVGIYDIESSNQHLHASFWGFSSSFDGGINFAR